MLSRFYHKSKNHLGIDISSASVKLIELHKNAQGFSIDSYAVAPIPQGTVVDKVVKDPETLTQAIAQTITEAKPKSKTAAIAVSDSSVITKLIHMDADMSEDEIESQIEIEAEKYIPYPLDEVRMDFDVLGPSAKNPDLIDVLLVASRAENVNSLVSAVNDAGLKVKVVDVESYAMERAMPLISEKLPNNGKDQTIAAIDIGANVTKLTVFYNMATVFTREEEFGGKLLTEDIQRHYGLSYREAGLAKKQGGMPEDYEDALLTPFKNTAVIQVRRALQFFFSASQHNQVNHLILAGGTVVIPGFADLIQQQIGIETTIANPFEHMGIAKGIRVDALEKDAPSMMIPCGLAMTGFDNSR